MPGPERRRSFVKRFIQRPSCRSAVKAPAYRGPYAASKAASDHLVSAWGHTYDLPVLVTDTTPWTAVNALGGGWCVGWADYGTTLSAALDESSAQLAARGAIAREWVLREFSWEQSARKLAAFYAQLCSPSATAHHPSVRP